MEAWSAHLWWEKGQLPVWIDGRSKSPALNYYVEVAASAVADVEIERQAELERERKTREPR